MENQMNPEMQSPVHGSHPGLIAGAVVLLVVIFVSWSPEINLFWRESNTLAAMHARNTGDGMAYAVTCRYFGIQIPRLNIEIGQSFGCMPI